MKSFLTQVNSFLVLAAGVSAVNYPAKPVDLTTPVQQRIAISGANGKCVVASFTISQYTDLVPQQFPLAGTLMRS
jgi:hypothetical protein